MVRVAALNAADSGERTAHNAEMSVSCLAKVVRGDVAREMMKPWTKHWRRSVAA